jgi:hypothetical protein
VCPQRYVSGLVAAHTREVNALISGSPLDEATAEPPPPPPELDSLLQVRSTCPSCATAKLRALQPLAAYRAPRASEALLRR